MPIFVTIAALLNKELFKDQLQTFDGLADDEISTLEPIVQNEWNHGLELPSSKGKNSVYMDACYQHTYYVLLQN